MSPGNPWFYHESVENQKLFEAIHPTANASGALAMIS
ncbi:hypothetical protein CCP3SC5AM1_390005 [Gammaproteobacteria bacterium]